MNLDELRFDPTRYMSLEEALPIIYQLQDDDSPFESVGEWELSPETTSVIPFMDEWTKRIDNILDKLAQGSGIYNLLIKERGCTLAEYKDLFNSSIDPKDYIDYPAYLYFARHTIDKSTLWNFTQGKQPNEQNYIKDLQEDKPTALSFFFDRLQAMIPYKNLKRSAYISGKAGSGKSELMKLLFYGIQKRSQSKNSATLVAIDPHGDLVRQIKNFHLNRANRERVIYIDPYLKEGYTPVINPLELSSKDERSIDVMAQQISKVFKELIGRGGNDTKVSTNMDAVLIPCIYTLLRKGDATLEDLQRFMDDNYNKDLVALGKKSPHKRHRTFFEREFHNSLLNISKSSIRIKLQSLLNYPTFANILCGKSTIDLEHELNSGKVILFNLSKGRIGDETSKAFGAFLVAFMSGIAMKREAIPEKQRKPTFAFIDECHNYIIESTKDILAEARKYALHLILANQYIFQISKDYQQEIKSNTDVKIAGRNDQDHFKNLAPSMGVKTDQLNKLKNHNFYIKVGDKSPLKFKPSPILIDDPSYYLTKQEQQDFDDYMVYDSGYYAKLDNGDSEEYTAGQKPDDPNTPPTNEFRYDNL